MEIKEKNDFKGNKNIKKTVMTTALFGTLSLALLTGCADASRNEKAIIFGDGTATIVEVERCIIFSNYYEILTKDGLKICTPMYDTKLITESESSVTAEEIAISIMGEDVKINYLGKSKSLKLNNN